MPETTVCAYCSSVIPASAKTCPMCGADNQPDDLAEVVAPSPLVAPAPPLAPDESEPVHKAAPPVSSQPRLQSTSSASPSRYIWILIGVMTAVLVCLCLAAVLVSNFVLGV